MKKQRLAPAGVSKLLRPLAAMTLLVLLVPPASQAARRPEAFIRALEKSEALMAQGRHQAAIRSLKKAEKLSQERSSRVLLNLALCFNQVGEFDKSEGYARAALEVAQNPSERANALYVLGLSLDSSVAAEEAAAAFRKVLELTAGQAAIAWFRLGAVLIHQEKYHEAYDAFSKYLERQPEGELAAEAKFATDSLDCWLRLQVSSEDGPISVPVSGEVVPPRKTLTTDPRYTPEARAARIQGVVIIAATIDRMGSVTDVEIVKDLPMGLGEAAANAVRGWKFEPATLDGEPVAFTHNVSTRFCLGPPVAKPRTEIVRNPIPGSSPF